MHLKFFSVFDSMFSNCKAKRNKISKDNWVYWKIFCDASGHCKDAWIGEKENAWRILVWKPEGKWPLGRDLKETGGRGRTWFIWTSGSLLLKHIHYWIIWLHKAFRISLLASELSASQLGLWPHGRSCWCRCSSTPRFHTTAVCHSQIRESTDISFYYIL